MPSRVLIVDDEEQILTILRHNLEQLGYEVGIAHDGREALRILRGGDEYEVVITDILMPECDGIELMTTIRRELPDMKVIAISAPGNDLYLDSANALGADAVIEKPFDTEKLELQLRLLAGDPA